MLKSVSKQAMIASDRKEACMTTTAVLAVRAGELWLPFALRERFNRRVQPFARRYTDRF